MRSGSTKQSQSRFAGAVLDKSESQKERFTMANFYTSLYSCRRVVSAWTVFAVIFATVGLVIAHAQGPTPATPPYALFQYSNLSGSANTLTATRVPVVTAPGKTIYLDLTLQFDVNSDGNLTLSSGYPQVFLSPALVESPFVPGRYVGPSTYLSGKAILDVIGPRAVAGGTMWLTSIATGGHQYTYPISATWYVGPIESSPYAARLKKAGIISTAWPWSYGVTGLSVCSDPCWERWGYNANILIGVTQIGNTLTIASFTYRGQDTSTPVDQITYKLQIDPTP